MITFDQQTFAADVKRFADGAKGDMHAFIREFLQDMNEAVVLATPVKTGFLRASWHASIGSESAQAGGGGVGQMNAVAAAAKPGQIYYAVNGAAYARHVEYGTRAHEIRPYRRKALRWEDASRMEHFARKVMHPGTTGRAFVRRTMTRASTMAQAAASRLGMGR